MDRESSQNEVITRYLLDQLPESEREQVIDRYLSDEEFFEQVLAVEEELIDDYAQDQLPPPDRARFERYFLTTPERRDRVKHARAFSRALAPQRAAPGAAPGWRTIFGLLRVPRPTLVSGLAAATALMFLGLAWFAVPQLGIGVRIPQIDAQPPASRPGEAERMEALSRQVAAERERAEQLAEELQRLRAESEAERASWQRQKRELQRRAGGSRSDHLIASFELPAGEMIVRGPGQPRTLAIKEGAELVKLRLNLVGEEYPSYRVVLRTYQGDQLISQAGLKAQPAGAGRAVVLSLPAPQLVAGDYIVSLSGVDEVGVVKELSQWPMRIERK